MNLRLNPFLGSSKQLSHKPKTAMAVSCLESYNSSRAKAGQGDLEVSGKYCLFHVAGAFLNLGESLYGKAREWLQGIFPLPAIVLVGRPAWEGHSSATAGAMFVYFLCLHPEPISGTGLAASLCHSSTDLPKPWVMSATCQERTVVVTSHLAYLPGCNPAFFGYATSFLHCPIGNCPHLALRVSIKYCLICSFCFT